MSTHSAPTSLSTWLTTLESRHPTVVDLGLKRVQQVKDALQLDFACPIISIAGTNGKGSTCAMLESILLQAGYRVGLYTSPHLIDFNERIRIDGRMVDDQRIVTAFETIDAVRNDVSLTYFEFTTLAALQIFADAKLDVVILEVGLGGRLDAVNVIDADVAIITSVDIDHTDYLGSTREAIGFEKAGIMRSGKTAICSDPVPPASLIAHAETIGADLWLLGRDFNYNGDKQQWNYGGREQRRTALTYPSLRGANQLLNASAALAALEAVRTKLPVSAQEARMGLVTVDLSARFQVLPGLPVVILDVAHNPHAAATLAQNLDNMGFHPYTYAVFGAMKDKDLAGIIAHLKGRIDHWCITDLATPRAATANQIKEELVKAGVQDQSDAQGECSIEMFASPEQAYANACGRAAENDRIAVFGSFVTVAGVMRAQRSTHH